MFNQATSKVKASVEWLFGDVRIYFKFIDYKEGLKLRLSPIGKFHFARALLQNLNTRLCGNFVSILIYIHQSYNNTACKSDFFCVPSVTGEKFLQKVLQLMHEWRIRTTNKTIINVYFFSLGREIDILLEKWVLFKGSYQKTWSILK